jgi:hypothetical protein
MVKEVDYSSLKGEFKELESEILPKKNNFRKDIRYALKDEKKTDTKFFLNRLNRIQDYANKGEFRKIPDLSENLVNAIGSYTGEQEVGDYDKYLDSISKRLDRASNTAIKYLKDNKNKITKDEIQTIKMFLDYSEDFKSKINEKKDKSSGLEKAITLISLGSMVLGIAIGYPALTGNVIAENVENFALSGVSLFLLGLLGVFLANKK